jgi:polyisoprenoid-binding protein YceI
LVLRDELMEQTAAGLDHYVIDVGVSRFTVRAFAGGMFAALGHNPTFAVREFTGEARFDSSTLEQAYLRINVKAGSLEIQDDISDKDRREIERTMNQEVLQIEKYPDIDFESSSVSASKAGEGRYWVNMIGNLSLRGITRSQPVAAQVAVNGNSLRANGEFSLQQTSYGIKLVSVAGGTLKLKDEVKVSFDIVARKRE